MALSEPVPMGQASSLFVQRRPQDTGALPERAKLCLLASPPPQGGYWPELPPAGHVRPMRVLGIVTTVGR